MKEIFFLDLKRLYKNNMIKMLLVSMLLIMLGDPLFVYLKYGRDDNFINSIGANSFQFWTLMNSSGWGNTVFYAFLYVFPVLSSGALYFQERKSSFCECSIIRCGLLKYHLSKILAIFSATIINFLTILSFNLIVVHILFSSEAAKTEQYYLLLPKDGTFAKILYDISPIYMEIFYTFITALVIAFLAIFVLGIQMIICFDRLSTSLFIPIIILYIMEYFLSVIFKKNLQYVLSVMIQPRAQGALVNIIQWQHYASVLGILIIVTILVNVIAYRKNLEIL